jgi:glycosyltransferase involved in cell wall biosynthesis
VAESSGTVTKTKLVYVLPTYDVDSAEHTFHIHGFLEALAEYLDIWLIIEHARSQPEFRNLKTYLQRTDMPILTKVEKLAAMAWMRLHGHKHFYTHYSVSAGILSALVTRSLGGVSFYWNCGRMMDFVPRQVRSRSDLGAKLRNQWLMGFNLRMVHHLVTGTPTMARYYSESYGLPLDSIRVMPNWVDLRRFAVLPNKPALRHELGWPLNKRIVLFLHRVAERKGAHFIVPIAERVLAQYPGNSSDLLFVIVGDGPYRENLEGEIRRQGLAHQFQLAGWVPNREAIKYFAAADVYMMPSAEEGFPRTLLEAMAAGCPFTATNVGGVRDIVTSNQAEFLVSADDWRNMAKALCRLLADETLRKRLGAEGYAHVQTYSQDTVVQDFVSLVSS